MYEPRRCPNTDCRAHVDELDGFFKRNGYYWRNSSPRRIPRYRCRHCGRHFSRQTLRADYRDHKPQLNREVFSRLCSGTGLRQIAREIGMAKRNLELKARKIARHLADLHHNFIHEFVGDVEFAFDELETFEQCRSTRPLTVPVLIEQRTTFIVDAACAPIPPSGRMTADRRRKIAANERRNGKRRNESRRICAQVLATAARHCARARTVRMRSDLKKTYPGLFGRAFGTQRLQHVRVSSKRKRDTSNPLHRINLAQARMRDLMGRLHRRSWLATKRGKCLDLHLMVFTCYRNYHRPRFNKDKESPAELLGFAPRAMSKDELLSWRQDWGPERSTHPLSPWMESVAEYRRRTTVPVD